MPLLFVQDPIVWLPVLTAFFGGYLSGSVPYGLLLGKLAGIGDIRKAGSGNIGATNALRLGGKKLGAATLFLDALKGALPVLVAGHFHMDYAIAAALGAFIGHLFPVWLRFRGGKGVATALGIAFGFSGLLGLSLCGLWLGVAMMSGYSSLSALAAFGMAPLAAGLLTGNLQVVVAQLFISIVVWARHHENIRRLIDGKESKINLKPSSLSPEKKADA